MIQEKGFNARLEWEASRILESRGLTDEDLIQEEYAVPQRISFYNLAENLGIGSYPDAVELATAVDLAENEVIGDVMLQPYVFSQEVWSRQFEEDLTGEGLVQEEQHEVWRTQLVEDIILSRYHLMQIVPDPYPTEIELPIDSLQQLTTEQLLSRLVLERLTLMKYKEDPEAQELHQALHWILDMDSLPVRAVDLSQFNHLESEYAQWDSVYAIVLNFRDYPEYRAKMLPNDDEIEIPEGELLCDIKRWNPREEPFHVMMSQVRIVQKNRATLEAKGFSFRGLTLEEIKAMNEEELIALIAYYEILANANKGDDEAQVVWNQLDHTEDQPIRLVEINGRSLTDRYYDRINGDKGLPTRYVRTYLAFGKKRPID